jgi:nicotinate (nicotinamide) nucleotide adenylyltransferase
VQVVDSPSGIFSSLVIVPGAFNPPTRAHVILAGAALAHADAVLFTLPSTLPHKEFTGASLEQRIAMLRQITQRDERLGTAVAEGGLYIDIAREARQKFPDAQITLLCGRDAAERIVGWSYDEPRAVERMLAECELLVAPREGGYEPPSHLRSRIRTLEIPNLDSYSSTRLRQMLKRGENWQELAPEEIVNLIAEIYRPAP